MRPAKVQVGATGPSPWVNINYREAGFGVGFSVNVQGGADLTYKVQHAFTDMLPVSLANLTRSTTTATATWRVTAENPTHGLKAGDCIFMGGYGDPFDGVYTVATITNSTVFTYTVANSGLSASTLGYCQRLYVYDHPIVTGATGSTDGNYAFNINYMRLNATAWVSGNAILSVNQGFST